MCADSSTITTTKCWFAQHANIATYRHNWPSLDIFWDNSFLFWEFLLQRRSKRTRSIYRIINPTKERHHTISTVVVHFFVVVHETIISAICLQIINNDKLILLINQPVIKAIQIMVGCNLYYHYNKNLKWIWFNALKRRAYICWKLFNPNVYISFLFIK